MGNRRTWTQFAVALLAVGALLAGCSSGRSSSSPPDTSAVTKTTTSASATSFGDLASPCGPGDATGATDTGVTNDAISIGYGDDAGFPSSPGLNHQMSDAVKAMVKWCNGQGGINGRQIDARYYDAKITEVANVWTDACPKEFFMVGQGFSLDAGQETIRRGCGLPSVPGFAVSPQHSSAPLKYEPSPVPADYTVASAAAQLAKLFPDEVAHAATTFANYSATIDSKDKVLSAFPEFGWKFLDCPQQYNIQGEADWKPFAQKLKDCGAQMVYFSGSPYPNFENLLTAADQLDYHPVWYVDVNFYDKDFAAWNTTGLADKVYFRSSIALFEEADQNPATQQYLDIVKADGGDASTLGMQSASAFLLWATAAKACGSDLTRACVVDKLGAIHDWTGGGLGSAADPGANLPTQCGMLAKVSGTGFERVTPQETGSYECDPRYAAPVTGDALTRAHLDADRHSQLQ
jgi:hypothetical protein